MAENKVCIDRFRDLTYGEAMEIADAQTESHKRDVFFEYARLILKSKEHLSPTSEVRESPGLGYRIDYEEMVTVSDGESSYLKRELYIYESLLEAETEMQNNPVRYSWEEVSAELRAIARSELSV